MSDNNAIDKHYKLNLQRLFVSRIKNNPNLVTERSSEILQQIASSEISESSEATTFEQSSIKKERLTLKLRAKRGIKKILIIFFYFPANFIRRFMTKNLQAEILQHHQNLQTQQNQLLQLIQTHQIEFQNKIVELLNNLQNDVLKRNQENLELVAELHLNFDVHKSDIMQLLTQLHLKIDNHNSDIMQLLTQLDHQQVSKTAEIITLIASLYLKVDTNLTRTNEGLNDLIQKIDSLHLKDDEQCILHNKFHHQYLDFITKLHTKADDQCMHIDRIENLLARNRNFIVLEDKNSILINTPMGYLFCSLDDMPILICLVDSGDLEKETRLLIQKLLSKGNIYIDVGANYGMHVLAAHKAMQGQGRIIAFEPFPRTAHLLEQSINLNQHFSSTKIIELHQKAVSNEPGITRLFLGKVSGHHSLYPLGEFAKQDNETVTIEKVRLDDVIDSDITIDLIKIDVEGAELDVIAGATKTIENNPNVALIVEFGPSHIARSGHTVEEWLDTFKQLGMLFKVINHLDGSLENWSIDQLKQTESVNLLFAKPTSTVWDKV